MKSLVLICLAYFCYSMIGSQKVNDQWIKSAYFQRGFTRLDSKITCAINKPMRVSNIKTKMSCFMQCLANPNCAGINLQKYYTFMCKEYGIDQRLEFTAIQNCQYYGIRNSSNITKSDTSNAIIVPSSDVIRNNCIANCSETYISNCSTATFEATKLEDCSVPYTFLGSRHNSYAQLFYPRCDHQFCLGPKRELRFCNPQSNESLKDSFPLNIKLFMQEGLSQSVNNWLVIMQRINGQLSFNRAIRSFEGRIGTPEENFWLGLILLKQLTQGSAYRLRIEIKLDDSRWISDGYESFIVDKSSMLTAKFYFGDNGDVLNDFKLVGRMFKAKDSVVPPSEPGANCATVANSAWWFNDECINTINLNAPYSALKYFDYKSGTFKKVEIARMMIKSIYM